MQTLIYPIFKNTEDSLDDYIIKWPVGPDKKLSQPNMGFYCLHKQFTTSLQ